MMSKLKYFIILFICSCAAISSASVLTCEDTLTFLNPKEKNTNTEAKQKYMSWKEAGKYADSLNFESTKEFIEWLKSNDRPENFPPNPHQVYPEWTNTNDFLFSKKIMAYSKAKFFARSLRVKNSTDFFEIIALDPSILPKNFPKNPERFYTSTGEWTGWNDFLGLENTQSNTNKIVNGVKNAKTDAKQKWMDPKEAEALIQTKNLTSREQFKKWSKSGERPPNFPSHPDLVYKDTWEGWPKFLGYKDKPKPENKQKWMDPKEAEAFIQTQEITSVEQFKEWRKSDKRPPNFPSNPDVVYKDTWEGWPKFLGTKKHSKQKNKRKSSTKKINTKAKQKWMGPKEAEAFIQAQNLTSIEQFKQWKKSGKKPPNFPSRPDLVYKDTWEGWPKFLGYKYKPERKQKWMDPKKAEALIQAKNFTSVTQFKKWSKSGERPPNFPSRPDLVYKDTWEGWPKFLGYEDSPENKQKWMEPEEAEAFIQTQNLTSVEQFRQWKKSGKRPRNFPSRPDLVYKDTWEGWPKFLGYKDNPEHKQK